MEAFILALEIVGTVAFAVSGALTGLKKHMDIFGVAILGLTTATGGGALRDIILGINPPAIFQNPIYALLSVCVAVVCFIPAVRTKISENTAAREKVLLIMDSVGLGVFTVAGIQTACGQNAGYNLFLLVFVGTLTGVGGGVLRDVLAGNTPYIFVKHIYACASLTGALLCALLWQTVPPAAAMTAGMAAVITLRLLSAHFKWNLPRAE